MPKEKRAGARQARVDRIAALLAARFLRQRDSGTVKAHKRPLSRRERRPRQHITIAYDLETSRIAVGTPDLKYLTAYGDDLSIAMPIRNVPHLGEVLTARFLIPEFSGARFIAWNANNFDVYFIAAALLHDDAYILHPYLTRSKNLRGLKVVQRTEKGEREGRDKDALSWEFLDGVSMTIGNAGQAGYQGKNRDSRSLKKFLETFAPDYHKMEAPDWGKVEFDIHNKAHTDYAFRDSEGLYHGIKAVEAITLAHFNMPLQPTIGNLGIKIFQANMPEQVNVWEPALTVVKIIRDYLLRGGYCFCQRQYSGPIWKYDINQAYAAAMRDTALPAGRCIATGRVHPSARCGMYAIRATKASNRVPFYYRAMDGKPRFGLGDIDWTWITSSELKQLESEHWRIEIREGYFWDDAFTMRKYVDKLELLRINAPGGPSGAQGTIMKSIGNNSYGKTLEQTSGLNLILSAEKPQGYSEYQSEDEQLRHIWFKFDKPIIRDFHQPQIGAFITAHVRMEVRRAAVMVPDAWIYTDTDCAMFSRDVSAMLPIDAKLYGKWKIEAEGEHYIIIDKKVYASLDGTTKHAKGMHIGELSVKDFQQWLARHPPKQTQIQRANFLRAMTGEAMFKNLTKSGSRKILDSVQKIAA